MLIQEDHSASFFDFGNLKTLKEEISDEELHQSLVDFHKRYIAQKMIVCVQSRRSLDELQTMVDEKFSLIPPGIEEKQSIPKFEFNKIFKPDFYEKIYYMKPRIPKKAMIITFALPPQIDCNESPSNAPNLTFANLSHIMGIFDNAGVGGIAGYLKGEFLKFFFALIPLKLF